MSPCDAMAAELRRVRAERDALRRALVLVEAALRKDSRDKSIIGDGVEYHLDGQTMGYAIGTARSALALGNTP